MGKYAEQFETLSEPWKRELRSRAQAAVERIRAKKKGHNDVFPFVREQMAGLKLPTDIPYGQALGMMKALVHLGLNDNMPPAERTVRVMDNGDVEFEEFRKTEAARTLEILSQEYLESYLAEERERGVDQEALKDIGY